MTRSTYNSLMSKIETLEKQMNGGKGSGNFGHTGRPGEIGGSPSDKTGKSEIDSLADEVYTYIDAQRVASERGDYDIVGSIGTKMGVKHIMLAKKLLDGNLEDEEKATKLYSRLEKDLKRAKGKEAKGRIEAKMFALSDIAGEIGDSIRDKYVF